MEYSFSFFQNPYCKYYPCHKNVDPDSFSCLFCFCPLYHMKNCPGTPSYLTNGIKDCTHCTLPHTDYKQVIAVLTKEMMKR